MPPTKKKSSGTAKRKKSGVSSVASSSAPASPRSKVSDDAWSLAYQRLDTGPAEDALVELDLNLNSLEMEKIKEAIFEGGEKVSFEVFKERINKVCESHEAAIPAQDAGASCPDPACLARLSAPTKTKGKETVKAMVRVRPFMKYEYVKAEKEGTKMDPVVFMTDKECQVMNLETGEVRESFKFDRCFWSIPREQAPHGPEMATQDDVFQATGVPAVDHAFNGYNTCIFAYGQTGSGKTHSMLGADNDPGIAPRLVELLFDQIKKIKATGEKTQFEVKVCFMEIYNEKVMDLLMNAPQCTGDDDDDQPEKKRKPESPNRKKRGSVAPQDDKFRECKVRYSPDKGTYVEGITRLQVFNAAECMNRMMGGMKYRAVASHAMNAQSSRSHAIFQLCLKQNTIVGTTRVSVINIVDLAGSERIKKTQATGSVLDEAKNINQSLTTLRRVIDVLIDNAKKRTNQVPPYRESMLTWVLKDSLGGNSKTVMIAAISPHISNIDDTMNTLRYALKAKSIVLHAHVNEEKTATMVAVMKAQIEELQKQLLSGGGSGVAADSAEMQDIRAQLDEQKKEFESAVEAQKSAEKLAEDIRVEMEQRIEEQRAIMQEEVKDEKKQRFAAVFRNAFLIEKKKVQQEEEVNRLHDALEKLQRELREVRSEADAKSRRDEAEISQLEIELEASRRREAALKEELAAAKQATRQMELRARRHERAENDLREELSKLSALGKEEVENLQNELRHLQSVERTCAELRSKLTDSEVESTKALKKINKLEEEVSRGARAQQKVLEEKEDLRKALAESQDVAERRAREMETVRQDMDREMRNQIRELKLRDEQVLELQEEAHHLRREALRAQEAKKKSDGALSTMRVSQSKQQRNIVFQANDLEEKQERIKALEQETAKLRQQLGIAQAQLVAREHAANIGNDMPSPRESSVAAGYNPSQDLDLRQYVAGKFFPHGDLRSADTTNQTPSSRSNSPAAIARQMTPPGERTWVGNGYVYGNSPHKRRPSPSPQRPGTPTSVSLSGSHQRFTSLSPARIASISPASSRRTISPHVLQRGRAGV